MELLDAEYDTGFYAYAYLEKMLAFSAAFDRLDGELEFPTSGSMVPVAAFGTKCFTMHCHRDEILENQVTVLAYSGEDDFVLRLNTTSENDEMVLAKIPAKKTLAETIADAEQRIKQSSVEDYYSRLQLEESLVIPILSVHIQRRYTELVDKPLQNKNFIGERVTEAAQVIRFRLDEFGAKLSSEAEFGISGLPDSPRHFIFDKPFLFYLKQKDSDAPYIAMWIETAEVLQKRTK